MCTKSETARCKLTMEEGHSEPRQFERLLPNIATKSMALTPGRNLYADAFRCLQQVGGHQKTASWSETSAPCVLSCSTVGGCLGQSSIANRPAPALVLREGDRKELARLTRSSSGRAGLPQRARIVLLAADGVPNTEIAELVGVSRPTVIGWRDRYLAG